MSTKKAGRLSAFFGAIAAVLATIPQAFKGGGGRSTRGYRGEGRMAFYSISDSKHPAHRRHWAH
jgi:hypothetical protein